VASLTVRVMAERYRVILEIGRQLGVTPQLEIWGFSKTLGRLSDAAAVAIEADHPDACILADVFHLYTGGSGFTSLAQLSGAAMHAFHVNDYPAEPPRDLLRDSHRVLPGDGVAPLRTIVAGLVASGFAGALSLEVFSETYWQRQALQVAREGLRKMKAACAL
jgi:sugar phosphate isomerase/epimerase